MFVTCSDYDDDMDIESLDNPKLKIRIPCTIEPGSLKVYDIIQENIEESGLGSRLISLSSKGEDFNYDIMNPQAILADHLKERRKKDREKTMSSMTVDDAEFRMSSLTYNPLKGYAMMWPYVAFSGMANTIWLYNAFDQKNMNRVLPPEQDGNF